MAEEKRRPGRRKSELQLIFRNLGISAEQDKWLDEAEVVFDKSRSEIVRDALTSYIKRHPLDKKK